MNAVYTYINWAHEKHLSVERNLGLTRDVVAICDMENGVEICISPKIARDLAWQIFDLVDEIERDAGEEDTSCTEIPQ